MSSTDNVTVQSVTDPPKPKPKSKSRNGCITCKMKRLKCDEGKPFCQNCIKRDIKCGGYLTRFKWKSFSDGKAQTISFEDSKPKKGSKASTPLSKSSSSDSKASEPSEINPVKTEPSAPKLSLKDHLELATMSMVGKSTKHVKLENELLAKGINPNTFFSESDERPLKMRRSHSTTEMSAPSPSSNLHRSYSASNTRNNLPDLKAFRQEFSHINGLQSLAEAAVDEMQARSPGRSTAMMNLDHLVTMPNMPPSPKMPVGPHPRDFPMNSAPSPVNFAAPATKDAVSDLNLTPSLSALINYVITNDDHSKHNEQRNGILGAIPDAPLSPLDLSIGSGQDPHTPVMDMSLSQNLVPRKLDERTQQYNQIVNSSSRFLMDVGDKLSRFEALSPSIIASPANESLMKTSEQEQILYLYSTYTSGIMSIKSGSLENPWRNIYLPLASNYTYLFNSIAAMTLFHLAGNSKLRDSSSGLRSKGYYYMNRCILELATGLSKMDDSSDNQLPADIALATCLNLAVSESWDTHTSSGIAHLKGAKSMIQKVLSIVRRYASDKKQRSDLKKRLVLVSDDEWRKIEEAEEGKQKEPSQVSYIPRKLQLLFNEWIYFEVLSQMTSYHPHDDKGIDLVATITTIIQSTEKKRDEDLGVTEKGTSPTDSQHSFNSVPSHNQFAFFDNLDTILQNKDYVDPLLGCAQSLFSLMGKVANLISKIRKSQEKHQKQGRNSLSNISQASELKRQLTDWKPNVTPHMADMFNSHREDSSWDLYSCVSTAEAYRLATLLYLHQAVPEVTSTPSHQLAEKVFILLASIPSNSNLYIIHIFPLLVSSCEAEPGEERDWCEARWALLVERIWIGNIDRAFEVVKEVWRRKDEHKNARKMEEDKEPKRKLDDPQNLSAHLNEIVTAIHQDTSEEGITSPLHWSTVMREWGWEVLLA